MNHEKLSNSGKGSAQDRMEAIAQLIQNLRDTERQLRGLLGNEIPAGKVEGVDFFLLHETLEKLRQSEVLQQHLTDTQAAILNALPARVALLDSHGLIVQVNEAWRKAANEQALHEADCGPGQNYLAVCDQAAGQCAEARLAAAGLRAVLSGKTLHFALDYPCPRPDFVQWFRLMATPLHENHPSGAVVMHIDVTERKLAEEKLRESEQQYRMLFEANPHPMWVYDHETLKILAVNHAAVGHYGYSREEFLGMTIKDLRPADDWLALEKAVREIPEGIHHSGLWRHRIKAGNEILVEITSHALDYSGRRAHLVLALDVTERLTVEVELERQASFVRFNPNPVVDLSADGKINYHNDAAKAMTRLLGQTHLEGILPPDLRALVGECLASGRARENQELHLADRIISWSFFPIVSLKVVHAYAADITERRRAEHALRINEALLQNAQRIAHLGHWELDLKTGRLDWSDEVHEIFGVPREQFGGTYAAFLACVHPEDRALMQQNQDSTLGRSVSLDAEHRIIRPDGTIRWVRERGEVTVDQNGQPGRLSGTVLDITEAKEAENALRASEERVRATFNSAPTGIAISELDGRYALVNPAYCQTLGYTEDELLAIDFHAVTHPDDLPQCGQMIKDLLAGKARVFTTEKRYRRKDGWMIWVRASLSLIRDHAGKPTQLITVTEDISERKATEDKLARSQALAKFAGRAAYLGGWMLELPENKLIWSDETCAIHDCPAGYQPSLEEGLSYFPPEARKIIQEHMRSCKEEGTPYDLELPKFTAKGRRIWVRTIGEAVRDAEGKIIGLQGAFQDITARHEAQEALQQSEERFKNVARATADAVWDWNLGKNILWWSEGLTKLFGYKLDEIEPGIESWTGRIHPEDKARVMESIHAVIDSRNDMWSDEYRFAKKDGTYSYVLDRGFVIRDPAGNALRMVGGMTDLTERKITELELARLNRALRLLSTCSDLIVHADSETQLLKNLCQLAVEIGGYRMAWIGYAEDDEVRTIRPVISAGVVDGYFSTIQLSWSENHIAGRGPAGQCIRTGQPVVCPDILAEDAFFHWHQAATDRGYRSVICLPLRHDQQTFGLLALYSGEARAASSEEIKLLQELADDVAFGINTTRGRLERRRLHNTMLKVAANVSRNSSGDFFIQLAVNMTEALGAEAAVIARLNPASDAALASTIAAVVDGKPVENFSYLLARTPCERLLLEDECVVLDRVKEMFPNAPRLQQLRARAYVGRRLANSAGQVIGLLFVAFDEPLRNTDFVTPTLRIFATRAAAELERQESEIRLREQASLLDKAQDAILVRDLNHCVTYWNKSCERLYGWTAKDVLGKNVHQLIYRDTKKFEQAMAQVMATGEWTGELHQRSKDDKDIVVEGHWTLVRDSQGVPISILCINTDITERKKIEAQFLRAQRMESIGTLAGGIAHDLNNVLAPILMSAEMLEFHTQDADARALIQTLKNCALRGSALVRQVLTFARGMQGERVSLNLRHLGGDIYKMMQETFPKNIEANLQADRELWPVVGDPTQLHQVLLNLCVNARDAMPEGGKLIIKLQNIELDAAAANTDLAAKPGGYVLLSVTDTGTGIPPEIRDRIFEPFFTTKEISKGTGLGLSTVFSIVKGHGGFIHLYSELGKGTTFNVYIPAQSDGRSVGSADERRPAALPAGQNELILLVDDEESIRFVGESILKRLGYRVLPAANGAEAITAYAHHQAEVALVITDMAMPVMDGPALIAILKTMNPEVKIIVSSGFAVDASFDIARKAGVRYFINKPYSAEALLKVVRDCLGPTK